MPFASCPGTKSSIFQGPNHQFSFEFVRYCLAINNIQTCPVQEHAICISDPQFARYLHTFHCLHHEFIEFVRNNRKNRSWTFHGNANQLRQHLQIDHGVNILMLIPLSDTDCFHLHDALKEAQDRGIAETDPSLDVEGWDTANKLLLCCHSIMDLDCSLKDISVEGISSITIEMIKDASNSGKIYKLIAEAKKTENGYKLSVRPTLLGKEDFLGLCDDWEMAVEIHSDLFGKMYHKIWEREPIPTASSMLRDCIHSFQIRNSHHKLEQLH